MSYAISVPVGHFSAQNRGKVLIHKAIKSVLTFFISAMTPKEDVYIAFERFDAEITARDNRNNEIAILAFDPSV